MNIGVCAHSNGRQVTTQYGAVPNTGAGRDLNITDNRGRGGHEGLVVNLGVGILI